MSELTTKLFLDIKEFEKYQEMLKCQVHIDEERHGEYCYLDTQIGTISTIFFGSFVIIRMALLVIN